jgi:hypothetical protein
MADAQCVCGGLSLTVRAPAQLVAVCHCLACQRRTGTSFSVNAFYAAETVEVSGTASQFVRVADSGRKVRMHFCPTCGSTVYWKPDADSEIVGVAVGALGNPNFPAPSLSVFEQSRHRWVTLAEEVERYPQGPMPDHSTEI